MASGEAQGALGSAHHQPRPNPILGLLGHHPSSCMPCLDPPHPARPAGSQGFTLGPLSSKAVYSVQMTFGLLILLIPAEMSPPQGAVPRFLRLVSILYCILLKHPHNSLYYDELHICVAVKCHLSLQTTCFMRTGTTSASLSTSPIARPGPGTQQVCKDPKHSTNSSFPGSHCETTGCLLFRGQTWVSVETRALSPGRTQLLHLCN